MKRFPVWGAVSAIAVLIVAGAAISGAPTDARVLDVNGDVRSRISGGQWKALWEGDRLPEGSEVLTAGDGTCKLLFSADGTDVVLVKTDTHASIVSTDPVRVDLETGGLMAYVKGLKSGSTFSVRTPVAIASVRGSGFGIDMVPSGRQTSLAFDDTLRLESASGGSLDVPEGKGVDLSNGTFSDTFDIPEDVRSEWQSFHDEAAGSFDSDFSDADDIEKFAGRPDTNSETRDINSETRDIKADDGLEIMDKPSGGY